MERIFAICTFGVEWCKAPLKWPGYIVAVFFFFNKNITIFFLNDLRLQKKLFVIFIRYLFQIIGTRKLHNFGDKSFLVKTIEIYRPVDGCKLRLGCHDIMRR